MVGKVVEIPVVGDQRHPVIQAALRYEGIRQAGPET